MLNRLTILIMALSIYGCAGVDFYNNQDLSGKKTGIPFYAPKPYVLVARTGAKDKPININVVYLPDLSLTYYAKPKSGAGSAKMNMAFSNGVMTSFGQETDPKLAELVTSLAGVPSSLATGKKLRAEAEKLLAEADDIREQASNLPELSSSIQGVVTDLSDLQGDQGYESAITETNRHAINRIKTGLSNLATSMNMPGAETKRDMLIKQLEGLSKQLDEIKKPSDSGEGDAVNIWNKFESIKSNLSKLVKDSKPKPKEAPTLSLYEVIFTNGATTLKEVPFEKAAPILE